MNTFRRLVASEKPLVLPGAHDAVEGAIDRDRRDLDQNLARARLRRRNLFEPHDLGRSEFTDDNGFDGGLPRPLT